MSAKRPTYLNLLDLIALIIFLFLLKSTTHEAHHQGGPNHGDQVARAAEFFTVAPNICGCLVQLLLVVTFLAPRNVRWLPDILENLCTPAHRYVRFIVFLLLLHVLLGPKLLSSLICQHVSFI